MFDLPKGQQIAMQWYGLAPLHWGWIIAAIAVILAIVAWRVRRPAWAHLREDAGESELDEVSWRRWRWIVVAGALLLHAPGFWGSFNIFDDKRQIHGCKQVTQLSWEHFSDLVLENWRGTGQELMYLSFQLNWALVGGYYPIWYLFNWLLLVPLVLLVESLVRHVTGSRVVAVLAAALFVTTPITAEIMCWMSARSHLYGLVLSLTSLACWFAYRRGEGRGRWGWLALSLLAFALSQMAKPIFVFLPLWLVIFDVYEGRRDVRAAVLDKLPHLALSVGSVYRIAVLGAGQRLIRPTPVGGSYYHTVLQDLNLLVEYLRTVFVPDATGPLPHFNPATGWLGVERTPQILAFGFAPLASLLILLSVVAVIVALRVRFKWGLPLMWLLAACVTFGTVMNIPYRGSAAIFEYRYAISAHLMTALLLASVFVLLHRSRLVERPGFRLVPVALASAMLTWGAWATHQNTAAWSSSTALWTRQTLHFPNNYQAHYYAGKAYQHAGEHHAALQYLYRALIYHNGDLILYKRLGDNNYDIGHHERAKKWWIEYFLKKPEAVNDGYLERFEEVGLDLEQARRDVEAGRLELR